MEAINWIFLSEDQIIDGNSPREFNLYQVLVLFIHNQGPEDHPESEK